MKNIAVMGYGVVGSGVVEVIETNQREIAERLGDGVYVKYILDLRDFEDSPYKDRFIKDFNIIKEDPEIDLVVEAMGGTGAAYSFVSQSLSAGKNAVTSNKALIAAKGAELLAIAKEKNVNLFFEAAVGGGIPIIRPLYSSLCANKIEEIAGILNGTTNFILTRMFEDNMDFDSALALAKKLGYAEADPTDDIEGYDACRKICILASIAFGRHVYPESVHTEGITSITQTDAEYLREIDGSVKLIGRATIDKDQKVQISVAPAVVNKSGLLASVSDVFNAVIVRGNAVGETMFYGRGAGKLPTASAVVADVVDALSRTETDRMLWWEDGDASSVAPLSQNVCAAYIRLSGCDEQEVADVFGEVREIRAAAKNNEVAFITSEKTEAETDALISKIMLGGAKLINKIRVYNY